MKLLLIPSCLWTDVILGFITGLPINNSYNAILIVVDCLTKKRYYILYTIDESDTITEVIAQLFLQNIWKLHGFSSSLTL